MRFIFWGVAASTFAVLCWATSTWWLPAARGVAPQLSNVALLLVVCCGIAALVVGLLRISAAKRAALLGSPHLVTPENFYRWTSSIAEALQELAQRQSDTAREQVHRVDRLGEQMQELAQTFMTLQRALDERDTHIKKLEAGRDSAAFRRFLTRFIRVDQALAECESANVTISPSDLRTLMRDALDECGVEVFSPQLGADFKSERNAGDQPELVPTADQSLHYKIASVVAQGYGIRKPDGEMSPVVPARVRVYVPLEAE